MMLCSTALPASTGRGPAESRQQPKPKQCFPCRTWKLHLHHFRALKKPLRSPGACRAQALQLPLQAWGLGAADFRSDCHLFSRP